ncbi:MAG: class I SAM-dependent methyltransferase [Gammaproteobacteria bacterium]
MNFKDHFSGHAVEYDAFRPRYPETLFAYLASLCPGRELAWDCATGSGQSAAGLAGRFRKVVATDASENQIAQAAHKSGVTWAVARAEDSGLETGSVDLITVAQALHWFDIDAFSREADRVLRGGGVLAAWTYNLLETGGDADREIGNLYGRVLGSFWPPERRQVEEAYAGIQLPFEEIRCPAFEMTARWTFSDLIGYLNTWSAVRAFERSHGSSAVDLVHDELREAWGDACEVRTISWPFTLRAWRMTSDR